MLDCPVCGNPVDPATAPTSVYRGVTYYLRCPGCKVRFDADPERFLRSGPDAAHGGCGHHSGSGGGCGRGGHHAAHAAPIRLLPPTA